MSGPGLLFVFILLNVFRTSLVVILKFCVLFVWYYIAIVAVLLVKHIIVTSYIIIIIFEGRGIPVIDYFGHVSSHIDSINAICVDIISSWKGSEE